MFDKTYKIVLKYSKNNYKYNDTIIIQSREEISYVKVQCASEYGLDNILSIKQIDIKKF
jgi:hypothetical protein